MLFRAHIKKLQKSFRKSKDSANLINGSFSEMVQILVKKIIIIKKSTTVYLLQSALKIIQKTFDVVQLPPHLLVTFSEQSPQVGFFPLHHDLWSTVP